VRAFVAGGGALIPETQAAFRNASTRLSHSPIWFQVANVWVNSPRSRSGLLIRVVLRRSGFGLRASLFGHDSPRVNSLVTLRLRGAGGDAARCCGEKARRGL